MWKRIILILMVLSPSVPAADYLDTYSKVRIQIRKSLRYDTTSTGGVSDAVADAFIKEGIVNVAPLVRSKKNEQTITTSYRQNTYSLDSLTIGIISVQWQKNDSIKSLLYVPMENWFEMEHKQTIGKRGYEFRPSYYDYTDDQIFMFPVPTNPIEDTIVILAYEKFPMIDTATTLTNLPVQYRTVVYKYALWKTASSLGLPQSANLYDDYKQGILEVNATLNRLRAVTGENK